LCDEGSIPARAILIGEREEVPVAVQPGVEARGVQAHQGHEGARLGVSRRNALDDQRAQAHRLQAHVAANRVLGEGCTVTLVEHQVQHGEHRLRPGRQLTAGRHLEGNAGLAEALARPVQTLLHGRLFRQQTARHLGGAESSEDLQGKRHLGLERQRGMAAGEHHAECVVVDGVLGEQAV